MVYKNGLFKMIFSTINELKDLSREDLENEAGILLWILINEVNGGAKIEYITKPFLDLTFRDTKLELDTNNLAPNKSTVLRVNKI